MNKRVMICDDDTDILEVTSIILEQKGFEVTTFVDCENIFDKVEQVNPDLILMDLWIPEMGGANVTLLLKSSHKTKDIPVILFSANNDLEKVVQEVGADGYLRKPFDIFNLEQVIDQKIVVA